MLMHVWLCVFVDMCVCVFKTWLLQFWLAFCSSAFANSPGRRSVSEYNLAAHLVTKLSTLPAQHIPLLSFPPLANWLKTAKTTSPSLQARIHILFSNDGSDSIEEFETIRVYINKLSPSTSNTNCVWTLVWMILLSCCRSICCFVPKFVHEMAQDPILTICGTISNEGLSY